MNLFSVFDPTSYFGISINWMIILMIYVILLTSYFKMYSGYLVFIKKLLVNVNEVFKEVADTKYFGIICLSLISFMYLIICNLMGLFPFIFTGTAHIMFTMGLGIVMWMSFFMMGWFKNFKNSAAHLVPEGSPLFLSPVLVLIESISHLMRPFTLSIRLAANMMAGHLIIGLLSSISLLGSLGMISSLMFQSLLLILEFGVAVIQGFVFSILLLLYAVEYY
uniref:ATP synthase F0 subunit 6 n=1 Tax=Parasteatoda cingulata TaxID=2905676 RepID=UPI002237C007|nr:ATP synthase F0 subunit 6 [Parasteatoda cingulata]UYG23917.1 ATP synthase F0 subunit 6 [Parasteatoda cingulata]